MGPGQYPQYTRADFGPEAVGSSVHKHHTSPNVKPYGRVKSRSPSFLGSLFLFFSGLFFFLLRPLFLFFSGPFFFLLCGKNMLDVCCDLTPYETSRWLEVKTDRENHARLSTLQ